MAMEDGNMLAADCVVISCCCQCLILQVIIFFLLKLPSKLIRKTKEYAKKKLRHRRRSKGKIIRKVKKGKSRYREELMEFHGGGSGRIELLKGFPYSSIDGEDGCMEEVEKVLEEFSQKGEFAFGSFWGREGDGPSITASSSSTTKLVAQEEFDFSVVQFESVEIIASLSYS
ncbi:hypothetical protein Ddye_030706 [Dipteronia dyeriana]|uniref:Uncharacterized protein n=1 Tax=Dipteronia dyeriana TaxID=168575 RepID=A0AAD9THW4_9ROSI|nr:hypothetical protein Ddye_030706 [Dipteronia dyeriana]